MTTPLQYPCPVCGAAFLLRSTLVRHRLLEDAPGLIGAALKRALYAASRKAWREKIGQDHQVGRGQFLAGRKGYVTKPAKNPD